MATPPNKAILELGCPTCKGSGMDPDDSASYCGACGGCGSDFHARLKEKLDASEQYIARLERDLARARTVVDEMRSALRGDVLAVDPNGQKIVRYLDDCVRELESMFREDDDA